MKKLSSVLSVIFVFVLASVLVFCNMSYVKADNEKAAAGVRYETINIDSKSLTGNAIWGLTESYSNVAMDDSAYFYADSSDRQYGGMPVEGKVTMQSGVPYQLVSGEKDKAYDGNDCIRLTPSNKTASINLETIGVYNEIYVLATAGGPGKGNYAKFTVTLTYTDGTTGSTEYRLYDWFDGSDVTGVEKYTYFRRRNISGGSYDGTTTAGPILHSATIQVDNSKLLKSVSFMTDGKTYSSDSGSASVSSIYCCIFAVTGATPAGVPDAPVATAATDNVKNISGGSYFTANWNSVSGATGYYLDVATDRNFTQMVSGYNNVSVGNVTNYKVTGLNADTTYYYRVRAYNNSGQSLSSNRVATGLPIWATDAGITEDGATYDAENGILTVNSSVQLKKSLVIPSGETTTITLVNKAEIMAPTGNSAITASGKDTGLIVNGDGTIKGGAGNDGSSGASGSAAIDMSGASGDSTVKVEGNTTIVGGNGGDATSNNGQGGNGGDAIKGNNLVKIDIAGGTSGTTSIIGGNGGAGKGSASGGAGGAGISSSNSIVTVGGNGSTSSDAQIIGGNGGNSESGNGGAGGTGVNGSKVTVNEGNITGGNGGNAGGNGTGGTGGTGVNGGNNITVNTGSNVTGGNGGNAESGTGGTGGKGVNGSTTSNSGTTTGGNGGNSQTGNVGNGGNAGTTTGTTTSGTSGKKIDISVKIESFNSIEQGSDVDEKTLTISNSSNSMVDATITSVKLESGEVFSISGSVDEPVTINKGTSNSTWKVKVKSGLKANANGTACTYTDTIIVTYDNGAVARKEITITVNPLMYTLDVIGGKVESCSGVSSGNKYAVGSTITVVADSPKTEYRFVGWSGIEGESDILIFEMPEKDLSIKAEYKDIMNPTGTIQLTGVDFKWNNLITDIKFNIFYKEYKTVSINANDNGSGVDSIYYYISKEALSEEDLKADTIDWIAYDNKFIINNNQKYVIYAKITDRAGNVTYISSDGLVIDTIKPIINGIEDNGTYCEDKNFTISDEYINSITIAKDGEEAKEITLNDSYTISASEKGKYLITVSDKAGNITAITIYMVEHKYSSQVIAPTVLDKGYTKYTCDRCNHEYMDNYVDALGVEGLHSYDENELNEIKAELTHRLQDEQNPPSESEKELYNSVDDSINKMLSDIDEAKKLIDKLNDIERKLSDVTEISIKNKEDIETSIITIDDLINNYSKSLTEDKKEELLSTKKKLEDMLKEAIEKDVDNKISDAEEISAGLVDLTDEEITKLNEKIKSIKEELNKEIANAKDKNQINDIYTKALEEIANEIDLAMNTDLSHAKDKAKNEIDKRAENEKLAIDNLDELTDIEKAQAKADIDAKAKSAKEALDLITDVSEKNQINEKLSEVNDAIDNIANKEENRNEGIKNAEAVWTDSDGYIHYGNLADMIEEAPADSIIRVKNNVEIDKNISIGSGKTIFVPDNKKVTIKDGAIVEIEKGASITNNGTIEINSEAKLNNNGKFSNATTGTVTNAGSFNNNEDGKVENKGEVSNTGTFNNSKGSQFDNDGTIRNDKNGTVINAGTLNNNDKSKFENIGKVENAGILNNNEGGKVENKGEVSNTGALNNNTGSTFDNAGSVSNSENGTVSNAGNFNNNKDGKVENKGTVENTGTLNNGKGSQFDNNGTIRNDKDGTVTNAGILNNNEESKFENNGTVSNAGDFNNNEGGKVENKGTVENTGALNNKAGSTFDNSGSISNAETGKVTNAGSLNNNEGGKVESKGTVENTGSLNNKAGSTFDNSGSISNAETGKVTNAGSLNNNEGGKVENKGTVENTGSLNNNTGSTFDNSGSISNTETGTVTNAGSLNNNEGGKVENKGAVENTGSLNNNTGSTFDNSGSISNTETGKVTNAGRLNNNEGGKVENKGTVENTGALNNKAGSTFDNSGSVSNTETGKVTNAGSLNNNEGGKVENKGTVENTGALNNNSGSTFDNSGSISNAETGTVTNAGSLNNNEGGKVENKGTVENTGSLNNNTGSTFDNSGSISNTETGKVTNAGNLNNNEGGTVENKGSVENTGSLNNNTGSTFDNSGSISNTETGKVTNAESLNNNEGGKLENKGSVENTGSLNNNAGSTFDNSGSVSNEAEGTVTNAGNFNNNEGGKLENTGVLNNTEGGKLDNAGNLTNNGEIRNNDGANINNSGAVNNSGNIVNNGTVSNAGDISNSESASIIGAGDIGNEGTINNAGNITVNGNVTGDGDISGSGSVQEKVTTIVVSEDNDTVIEDSVSADVGDGNVTIIIDSLDENNTTAGNIITGIKISSAYNLIKSAAGNDGMLLIQNGSDIMLRLSVIKKNGNVTEDVKNVMENATENTSITDKKLVIGEYVDLIYEMKKNKEAWTKLSELQNEIEITIAVPDELKGKNVYYILRNHDGVCDMLMDLDDDPDTITFRTDRFSTYAIVYEEEPQVQESVKTGDNGMVNALAYMLMACLALASMGIILKKKSYAK